MMTDREFNTLVRVEYEQSVDEGGILDRKLLVQRIMSHRVPPDGPDADFFICGTQRAVRAEVEKHIRTRAPGDEETTLPGFEFVQASYSITRNGELVDVPTALMTDDELELKALELERQGLGMLKHAAEIRRLAAMRRRERSAPPPS